MRRMTSSAPQRRVTLVAVASLAAMAAPLAGCGSSTNGNNVDDGNILIADQYNNRVIEIDRKGNVVWSFGDQSCQPGPTSIVGPNDAERLPNGKTLIAGTGVPMGAEPNCMGMTGCQDNRVIIVDDASGTIDFTYGTAGVAGSDANQLNTPVCAVYLKSGNILITDQGNERVIEVDSTGKIVWQFGETGTTGMDGTHLDNPNSAERLDNGNTLIADENNNRVIEVSPSMAVVWTYPASPDTTKLSGAAFASRLPSGNTLITDSNNNRVVEVSPAGAEVWSYTTNTDKSSNPMPLPTRGIRLANGDTLIADQNNHRVIEVDNTKSIVFSYGAENMAGNGAGQCNGPYDAKVVGDFTGLTPPM
jgi:hypothetical protein